MVLGFESGYSSEYSPQAACASSLPLFAAPSPSVQNTLGHACMRKHRPVRDFPKEPRRQSFSIACSRAALSWQTRPKRPSSSALRALLSPCHLSGPNLGSLFPEGAQVDLALLLHRLQLCVSAKDQNGFGAGPKRHPSTLQPSKRVDARPTTSSGPQRTARTSRAEGLQEYFGFGFGITLALTTRLEAPRMRGSQRNRQTCRTSARKGHNSNRIFLYRSKSQRAYENPGAAWGVKLGSCSSEASENCEGTPNPNVKLNLAGIPTPKRHTHAPSLLHRIVPDRVELQPLALTASGDLCSLDSGQGPGCSGMLWRLNIGFRIGPMRARPGILF